MRRPWAWRFPITTPAGPSRNRPASCWANSSHTMTRRWPRTPLRRSSGPLKRAVVLPRNAQAPSALVRTLVDGLIVLDDIKTTDGAYGWSPTQLETGSGGGLSTWMKLPWGGPEWIVLPGFHTAAENGVRKGTVDGNDLFLATCGLMSTGVRTILISRWRPGGQSSFDLVREFSQELPHAVGGGRLAASGAVAHPRAARHGGRAAIEEEHQRRGSALVGAPVFLGRLHARRRRPTRRRASSSSAAAAQRQAEGSGAGGRRRERTEPAARRARRRRPARRRTGRRHRGSAGSGWSRARRPTGGHASQSESGRKKPPTRSQRKANKAAKDPTEF